MTPERWNLVLALFRRASERAPAARPAMLDEACGDDSELRRDVEALLTEFGAIDVPALERTEPAPTVVEESSRPDSTDREPEAVALLGTTLDGKYRVEELLGRGGMGEVYRARHLQLERDVALKLIRADYVADRAALDRFVREARMVARLRHPNVVAIYDYGAAAGTSAYLVMEYLQGRTLRAALREQTRFDAAEALGLVAQVCAAVAAAHDAGMVHRDLKPDNVFIERGARGPVVKVLDFGLAKPAAASGSPRDSLSLRGGVLGTPAYMAPEQCLGLEADARSDVYALGCLLYEMLTGAVPFLAPTIPELLMKHVYEPPERPSTLVAGIDPAIEAALLGALSKRPEDRPRSADAFAHALGVREPLDGPATLVPVGTTTGEGRLLTGLVEGGPAGPRAGPTNLRHAVTRFVGRHREIADLRGWIARTRLVTLVGPGGIGKTRLATETAALVLGEYRDGVWLVELAALTDPSLVDETVASALGVGEQGERPIVENVVDWLRPKRLLLVLDNCEHLIDECARLAERLLGAAPELRVLATSREPLAVPGEAVWQVPALAVPTSAEHAFESEAAALFVDRAALARPGFDLARSDATTVLDLCRRLEGIPLAIELAAARVKTLTVEQILERLDDRFRLLAGGSRTATTRQQTLHATIEWSYDLLDDDERLLFRQLSVFVGGWTLASAEQVVSGPQIAADGVFDLLTRLVDKSLVTVEERGAWTRYGMLEMIRALGIEHLERSGEADEVRRRHAQHFLAEAEATRSTEQAKKSLEWLERFDADHDNVRSALGWLLGRDADRCLRLAIAFWEFWLIRGHLGEAGRWIEGALDRSRAVHLRPMALLTAGELAYRRGDLATARDRHEASLRACDETGNAWIAAWSRFHLALVVLEQGNVDLARTYLDQSLASAIELDNERLAGNVLNVHGEIARSLGDWATARTCYERSIASHRRVGYEGGIGVALCNLGATAAEQGDLQAALGYFREALDLLMAQKDVFSITIVLDGFGAVAAEREEWTRAARLAGAADAIRRSKGFELETADRAFRERYLARARERLGEAELDAATVAGRALSLEESARFAIDDPL